MVATIQAALASTKSDHTAGKKHAYALSDFGLSEEDVKAAFSEYFAYFDKSTKRHLL